MDETPAPAPARPGHRRRAWWLLAAVGASLALVGTAVLGGGGGPNLDGVAQAGLLQPVDLADAAGGGHVRTNPPVDLATAERVARASFGQIPLPAGRAIASWQRPDTGHQVTQVILHYPDPDQAAQLDAVAVRMLPNVVGLHPEAVDLPGAQDARLWRADNYRALTFRQGGDAVLLGTTDTADPDVLARLAALAMARLAAASATLATPTP